MKQKSVLIIFFMISFSWVYAQQLVGIWQAKSKEITSAYFETYQFFKNATFKYNTNQYDGMRRVISIEGDYYLKKDTLYLTPKVSNEIEGGTFGRSELSTLNDSWEIINGKLTSKKVKKITSSVLIIFIDKELITIDGIKYYLLNSNPEEF
jgi:hypothetical protein